MRKDSATPGAILEGAETLSASWGWSQARGYSWRAGGGAGPKVAARMGTCRGSAKSGKDFESMKILL